MEVEIMAKKISLLPSSAALRMGIPSSSLRKDVFCDHNTIIHYQARGQHNTQQR